MLVSAIACKAFFMLVQSVKAAAINQLENNVNQLTISFDLVSDATSAGIVHENDLVPHVCRPDKFSMP